MRKTNGFCFILFALIGIHSLYAESLLIIADEQEPMKVLAQFLSEEAGYTVDLVDQPELPNDISPYRAVFQYIHGTMTDEVSQVLIDYAHNGGRLILLHHAIASARWKNPDFLEMVGIHLNQRDHPSAPWRVIGNTTHTLVNLNPRHYITSHNVTYDHTLAYESSDKPSITREWPVLEFTQTEVFLNQHFTDGQEKTVLFGFVCTDPETGAQIMQDRSGWLKPVGNGWVFYFQPGHAANDFKNRNYCQILWNCLTWKP